MKPYFSIADVEVDEEGCAVPSAGPHEELNEVIHGGPHAEQHGGQETLYKHLIQRYKISWAAR